MPILKAPAKTRRTNLEVPPMPLEPSLAAHMAPGFEPIVLSKQLLRALRSGALASLTEAGMPFASLTSVATDYDGTPIILISRLATHTLNLERDPRCSLMLSQTGKGDPLAHPRLTLLAHAERAVPDSPLQMRIRTRFLNRHPKAALYADFPDFSFWRLVPDQAFLNGGFARAWDGPANTILTEVADPVAAAELEAGAIAHMNADHGDALGLYATRLAGQPAGAWKASGLDPEGLDLMAGDRTARIAFSQPVTEPGPLRRALAALAEQARAATQAGAAP
ncbi:MAG TPA: DUF2470 domain-containing protein [Beijerinckiaceae bacterium]|nr:DUF2470 domain-containing protein [Beijerinckiaceae bacterium]